MTCYKFIVLFFILTAIRDREAENIYVFYPECQVLVESPFFEKSCCLGFNKMEKEEVKKSCKTEDKLSCEEATCLMEKNRQLRNGTVLEDKVLAMWDEKDEEYPDVKNMTKRIRHTCLKGKYKRYPHPECPALQLQMCTYMNALMECPLWKEERACKALYLGAAQCKITYEIIERVHFTPKN